LILFEGHYHGWSEALFHRYHAALDDLPAAGFGPALPGTDGMNGSPTNVVVCRWNDAGMLEQCLEQHRGKVAAVIMEPVMGNAGVIPPRPGYLQAVRELTLDHEALLVFDEVITGLRVAAGGAQEHYLVGPDITVISKALGAGYPVAAFGASREIMQPIVDGKLFHGGVYSGNAAVMAAAEAATNYILRTKQSMYPALWARADQLAGGLRDIWADGAFPISCSTSGRWYRCT
jgi:glutamate-1-semialdehyde 2,1-aminomutase